MDIKTKVETLELERIKLRKKSSKIFPLYLLPIAILFSSFYFINHAELIFYLSFFAALFVLGIYSYHISDPFKTAKIKLRTALLDTFMKSYHPDINYQFNANKDKVKKIVKSSKLIKAEIYEEEDVITGSQNNIDFYISEVRLKRKLNKSNYTIFKGILFKLKIPGKKFPKSQIQSKPGLIKKLFNTIAKNEDFGFYFDSKDTDQFNQDLQPLFPFFQHLMRKNKDIRISIENDELVLLLESDIKFLDDPKPSLHAPFDNTEYYSNIAKHLNSFLFIVESLAGGLDALALEEKIKMNLVKLIEEK